MVNVESKCNAFQAPKAEDFKRFRGKFTPLPDLSPNDGRLVVVNSEIACGVMDKATIGSGKKRFIFAVMIRDFGPDDP